MMFDCGLASRSRNVGTQRRHRDVLTVLNLKWRSDLKLESFNKLYQPWTSAGDGPLANPSPPLHENRCGQTTESPVVFRDIFSLVGIILVVDLLKSHKTRWSIGPLTLDA
eukprot:GABV01013822.1.p2 GENE.GABV01013822.1~~GABV01013822.1.p2  ORF type:complete len:110 (-),score=8.77 GABV01013822.1:3-332(-)